MADRYTAVEDLSTWGVWWLTDPEGRTVRVVGSGPQPVREWVAALLARLNGEA